MLTFIVPFAAASKDIAITNAAAIEATFESNRSAPIPATSPTLSPTLSAITAGFLGSSSGMPSSTLPTKSALISAVFVKIPPPAFANNASELAPKLKPSKAVVLLVIIMIPVTPKRLTPTTAIPITAPPRKPAIKDGLMPCFAASADLTFAIVAISIPTFPANAEKTVPNMYANAIVIFGSISPCQIGFGRNKSNNSAITAPNLASTLYSCLKKVFAPSRMSMPTSAIFAFDEGLAFTQM